MQEGVYYNGKFLESDQAKLSAFDRGFLFGDIIFETLVCFQDQILKKEEHLDRIFASAKSLEFELPWSRKQILEELQLAAANLKAKKGFLRLVFTPGAGMGLKREGNSPERLIYAFSVRDNFSVQRADGIKLKACPSRTLCRGTVHKSNSYQASILALKQARRDSCDDILWFNLKNELTEAATANIFLLHPSEGWVTPDLESGLLKGTTRAVILKLAAQNQIKLKERFVYFDELGDFEEAFLCSTVRGLIPIKQIDGFHYQSAHQGSSFRRMEQYYVDGAAESLGFPIDWDLGRL